jgi:single-strand DNA-binding protein
MSKRIGGAMNTAVLSGNLLRDPVVRTSAGGATVMCLTIASDNRKQGLKSGKWEDCTDFFDCVMFGARAQNICRALAKGTKVTVFGSLRTQRHTDDDTSTVRLVIESIEFASRKDREAKERARPYMSRVYGDIPF